MVNQLKLGVKVFSIHHADGSAHPSHYFLEQEGIVKDIRINEKEKFKVVDWGKACAYSSSEYRVLTPNNDGFCYYMSGLENMEQYLQDNGLYKVPTKLLKTHMKSYKSPWEA